MAKLLLLAAVIVAVALVNAQDDEHPFGRRVLAILENSDVKNTHSIFFKALEEHGYNVDFANAGDRGLSLRKYGEWKYDHLVLFAPSVDELHGVSENDLVEFIDDGKNILVATDSNIGGLIASLASECNVEFDDKDTTVVDHFNFDVSDFDGKHNLLVADNIVDSPVIFGGKTIESPVLFRGVGQDIEEGSSLLFPVLTGYATTYSTDGSDSEPHVAGTKTVLVSALQARNNARVVFAGSLELFSDKFFASPAQKYNVGTEKNTKFEKSGNEQFAKQLVRWTFKERGVLRVKSISHHKAGETEAPEVYTIKDDIVYSIQVEELKGKKWVPYNAKDMQLEFIMLDPYVRTSLVNDGNGVFTAEFKVPDVYGFFTFKVEYTRKGYTHLNAITRVPVRPFRHNQYERFIGAAFPYYASAFSMIAGLFVFSFVFLYHKDK